MATSKSKRAAVALVAVGLPVQDGEVRILLPEQNAPPRLLEGAEGISLTRELIGERAIMPTVGGFQFLVLCAVAYLGARAYGGQILEWCKTRLDEPLNSGHVYGTAGALVYNGLLKCEKVPNPTGRGKAVTLYSLTSRGKNIVRAIAVFFTAERSSTPRTKDHGIQREKTTKRSKD